MAIVESLGRIQSIEPADTTWWPGFRRSILHYNGSFEDYGTLYRKQPNVRTVVDFLARNIAQLGIKPFRRVSDTEREHARDHPLGRVLRRPNPWTTRYRLITELMSDMGIYYNALWLKVKPPRGDAAPLWLVPLPPDKVEPQGDTWLYAESFKISGRLGDYEFGRDQVVHFRGYNPEDRRWGLSPLETLRRTLAEEAAAGEYRENFWHNAARAETVLMHPKTLSDGASRRLRADWESLYTGAENSGRTAILEEGLKVERISFNARESQYLEVRKLSREEVAAAYHVPPPMVGVLDHATFSNISEQHRMLYQDTLGPWLEMITEEIELQLLPDLGDADDVYVEFNLEEKLRGSFEEQTTALQSSVGAPWMTRSEARARMNLPHDPAFDEPITPLNVLVGGLAAPNDTAPPPALAAASVIAQFLKRQKQSVLSAIGAKGFPAGFDAARWQRELTADLEKAGVRFEHAKVFALVAHVESCLEKTASNGRRYGAVYDALIAELEKEAAA